MTTTTTAPDTLPGPSLAEAAGLGVITAMQVLAYTHFAPGAAPITDAGSPMSVTATDPASAAGLEGASS